ncbi:hypothetical protein BOVATA_030430 [Babesia ovata]|uniref:Uncharacterized protein n=1 Tax=Babesia ovata TaxID=189622 RepID=A0A2H6KEX4_9APIC|nr:uncharacterized protein BOVATA_030430 [Babesia ovata]GBE61550.1 hypothetical protein BOVATA_030430 [Babesia ovata]
MALLYTAGLSSGGTCNEVRSSVFDSASVAGNGSGAVVPPPTRSESQTLTVTESFPITRTELGAVSGSWPTYEPSLVAQTKRSCSAPIPSVELRQKALAACSSNSRTPTFHADCDSSKLDQLKLSSQHATVVLPLFTVVVRSEPKQRMTTSGSTGVPPGC